MDWFSEKTHTGRSSDETPDVNYGERTKLSEKLHEFCDLGGPRNSYR